MLTELDYLARRIAQERALLAAAVCTAARQAHAAMATAYQMRHTRLAVQMATLL